MKTRRVLCILIAAVLVLSVLAACQSGKTNQAEASGQTETTIASEENNIYDMDNYESSRRLILSRSIRAENSIRSALHISFTTFRTG